VTRKDDSSAGVSFAGHNYKVGKRHVRRQVQVAIVGDQVEVSAGGEVLRVTLIRHDRSRENGAFANAGGGPSRSNAARPPRPMEHSYRSQSGTRVPVRRDRRCAGSWPPSVEAKFLVSEVRLRERARVLSLVRRCS
jgi:hypothetical protein